MRHRKLPWLQKKVILLGILILTSFLLLHIFFANNEKETEYQIQSLVKDGGSRSTAQLIRDRLKINVREHLDDGTSAEVNYEEHHIAQSVDNGEIKDYVELTKDVKDKAGDNRDNEGIYISTKALSSELSNEDLGNISKSNTTGVSRGSTSRHKGETATSATQSSAAAVTKTKSATTTSAKLEASIASAATAKAILGPTVRAASATITAAADVTAECLPKEDPSGIKTSFKFYIYDLPKEYNFNIQHSMSTTTDHAFCYNLMYCGMGEELFQYSFTKGTSLSPDSKMTSYDASYARYYRMSVRNSHQFALETLMHYKLLHSPYRTTNPDEADAFYIPVYTGLQCLNNYSGAPDFIDQFFKYLKIDKSLYFTRGKPHFSTLSKIQREQGSDHCTTLRHKESANITWIAIEEESNPYWSNQKKIHGKSIIVAPYPSYIHFANTRNDDRLLEHSNGLTNLTNTQFVLDYVPPVSERDVFLFMAAGTRRSNSFRAQLIDQFQEQTDKSYEEYFSDKQNSSRQSAFMQNSTEVPPSLHSIMLKTPECAKSHRYTTIPWMMKSIFCLNPPGDSPTRKSFYDSILSGCIPVVFSLKYNTTFPFQRRLPYEKFTITIDENLISQQNKKVTDILQKIPREEIVSLHKNLRRVAKWFQYSVPDGSIQRDDDAMTLIMEELKEKLNL